MCSTNLAVVCRDAPAIMGGNSEPSGMWVTSGIVSGHDVGVLHVGHCCAAGQAAARRH